MIWACAYVRACGFEPFSFAEVFILLTSSRTLRLQLQSLSSGAGHPYVYGHYHQLAISFVNFTFDTGCHLSHRLFVRMRAPFGVQSRCRQFTDIAYLELSCSAFTDSITGC
jgi:hypothetical protein